MLKLTPSEKAVVHNLFSQAGEGTSALLVTKSGAIPLTYDIHQDLYLGVSGAPVKLSQGKAESRQPYHSEWEHGFETRDGLGVTLLGTTMGGEIVWKFEKNGYLFNTNIEGKLGTGESPLDVFCSPDPSSPNDTELLNAVIEQDLHIVRTSPSKWSRGTEWVVFGSAGEVQRGTGRTARVAIVDWLQRREGGRIDD